MSMSDHRTVDPALSGLGRKPTDRSLPMRQRTRPGPYLLAIVAALIIGIALIAFGTLRFSQSTTELQRSGTTFAPGENLVPSPSAAPDQVSTENPAPAAGAAPSVAPANATTPSP